MDTRKSFGFDCAMVFSFPALGAVLALSVAALVGCGDDDTDTPDTTCVSVAHLSPDAPARTGTLPSKCVVAP